MKIAFVSVALNIHQVCIADEYYKQTNGNFWFIETGESVGDNSKGGREKEFSSRPYLINTFRNALAYSKAIKIIQEVDVVIYGAAPLKFLKERIRTGKLTFINGERWLKRGLINLLSPNLIKQQWLYHTSCYNKPVYALCSSAYAAGDYSKMFSFKNKCFKWGYFTAVSDLDIHLLQKNKSRTSTVKILWVARFLQWKHPEIMLQLALRLKKCQIDFVINMIGIGPEYANINRLIKEMGLDKYVNLLGQMQNHEVINMMRTHDIFCFTSDRNEGWGAVLNEAMSNGCCSVSSIDVGSTPFLIQNGVNGLTFNLKKRNDLFEKVLWLINNPKEREKMSIEAYKTMHNIWSPENAVKQFIALCNALLDGKEYKVFDGPCSKA